MFPDKSDMQLVQKIKPQKNLFLSFLSTPNSYHSVPQISGATDWRKFIYVGVSVTRQNIW